MDAALGGADDPASVALSSSVTRSATGWGVAKANEAIGGGVQEWLLGEF